jgi:hypothetical protein
MAFRIFKVSSQKLSRIWDRSMKKTLRHSFTRRNLVVRNALLCWGLCFHTMQWCTKSLANTNYTDSVLLWDIGPDASKCAGQYMIVMDFVDGKEARDTPQHNDKGCPMIVHYNWCSKAEEGRHQHRRWNRLVRWRWFRLHYEKGAWLGYSRKISCGELIRYSGIWVMDWLIAYDGLWQLHDAWSYICLWIRQGVDTVSTLGKGQDI